jgi:hypothetical protein
MRDKSPQLIGRDVNDLAGASAATDARMYGNSGAKASIDIALHESIPGLEAVATKAAAQAQTTRGDACKSDKFRWIYRDSSPKVSTRTYPQTAIYIATNKVGPRPQSPAMTSAKAIAVATQTSTGIDLSMAPLTT